MRIRNQIPNMATMMNLLCGSVAVAFAFSGQLVTASWLIILAVFFDFSDGLLARTLRATSAIGAQLDSLADVISFGLAPSAILYVLLRESHGVPALSDEVPLLPFTAFIFVGSAAFRLARFNAEDRANTHFRGLPAPAAGLFVASLPLVPVYDSLWKIPWTYIGNEFTLLAIAIVLPVLMVSRLRLLSLKFVNFKWQDNRAVYILAGSAAILLPILLASAIPFIITIYIILSLSGK